MYQMLTGSHKRQSRRVLCERLDAAAFPTSTVRMMTMLCPAGEEGEDS